MRVLLTLVAAALLAWLLLAPARDARTLVVLTAGAATGTPEGLVVRLPEAPEAPEAESVPDLATARRRHPDATRLRVVGHGLTPRDLDAACEMGTEVIKTALITPVPISCGRAVRLEFDPSPAPTGIVELDAPTNARAGGLWRIAGRANAPRDARVELRDPGGALAASVALDEHGRFALAAPLAAPGAALFELRLLGAGAAPLETLPLPVEARAGDALRVLLLAGAPGPETKYLKRWLVDAGAELAASTALTLGIEHREGRPELDAAALAGLDLAILDERAWSALDRADRDALARAVRGGLGLLLRVGGPIPDAARAEWNALGWTLDAADVSVQAPVERTLGELPAGVALARQPLRGAGPGWATLARADDAAPLGAWSAHGAGRVGAWWLDDSYRMVLAGHPERHGDLWSGIARTLARARGRSTPVIPGLVVEGERATLCGLEQEVRADDQALAVGPDGCAAFWPRHAGWHTLVQPDRGTAIYARAKDEARALRSEAARRATSALAGGAPTANPASGQPQRPLLFLAWLAAVALLWWRERTAR